MNKRTYFLTSFGLVRIDAHDQLAALHAFRRAFPKEKATVYTEAAYRRRMEATA